MDGEALLYGIWASTHSLEMAGNMEYHGHEFAVTIETTATE